MFVKLVRVHPCPWLWTVFAYCPGESLRLSRGTFACSSATACSSSCASFRCWRSSRRSSLSQRSSPALPIHSIRNGATRSRRGSPASPCSTISW